VKRPSKGDDLPPAVSGWASSSFREAWPCLHEWMSADKWEDGGPRATTTLFLFVDAGCLKVMLKDRDAGRVLFLSAASLDELLAGLEARLREGTGEWKVDRPPAGRGRSK